MIYSLDEIRGKIIPIAKKHNLSKVYLFGSYARNEADDESDVDLAIVDDSDNFYSVYLDYQEAFDENVDVLSESMLLHPKTNIGELVKRNFLKDRILLYENT